MPQLRNIDCSGSGISEHMNVKPAPVLPRHVSRPWKPQGVQPEGNKNPMGSLTFASAADRFRGSAFKNKKTYECEVCGAVFGTHGGRYYHMAMHTGQYKYNCQLCDKGFMKTDAFNKHMLVHRKQIKGKM